MAPLNHEIRAAAWLISASLSFMTATITDNYWTMLAFVLYATVCLYAALANQDRAAGFVNGKSDDP